MSKDDIEIPPAPPRKRRQLEDPNTLDKWLAIWATDDELPPSQRKRAQEERDRRKRLVPDVKVGILVGEEGMTPAQAAIVAEAVAPATELHAHGMYAAHLRKPLSGVTTPCVQHGDYREVIRYSTSLVATPKEPEKPDVVEGVWQAVRYAKHRKVAVKVVMPNGRVM